MSCALSMKSTPIIILVLVIFFCQLLHLCIDAALLSRVYRYGPVKLTETAILYHEAKPSADVIYLALVINDSNLVTSSSNWLGIGISETTSGSMLGADIVTAHFETDVLDKCTITDRYVPFVASPLLQSPAVFPEADECSESDWKLIACVRDPKKGTMTLEVKRTLSVTDNRQDRPILSGFTSVIHAYGDRFGYHGVNRHSTKVVLFSGENDPTPPTGLPLDVHGHVEVRATTFRVPQSTTSRACTTIRFPLGNDSSRMIVAMEPVINDKTRSLVQHISLFLCSGEQYARDTETRICEKEPFGPLGNVAARCSAFVYGYTSGGTRMEYPEDVGLPVDNSRPYLVMEILYSNPTLLTNTFDTSGIRVYYTSTRRKYEVGSLLLGDPLLSRNGEQVVSNITYQHSCPKQCTSRFSKTINVFSSYPYMRSFGRSIYTNLFNSNGKYVSTINKVNFWSENFQQSRRIHPVVRVVPGQQLQTSCVYDVSKAPGTKFGLSRLDESCIDLLQYWPAQRDRNTNRYINLCGYLEDEADSSQGSTICGDIVHVDETLDLNNFFSGVSNPAFDDTIGAWSDFGMYSSQCPAPSISASPSPGRTASVTPEDTTSLPEHSSEDSAISETSEDAALSSSPDSSLGTSPDSTLDSSPDTTAASPSTTEEDPSESASSASALSNRKCFPAAATVTLRSGQRVRMDCLQVGDEVAVGNGAYSRVFMFTHADKQSVNLFIEVICNRNVSLSLSPGHMLPANGRIYFAREIQVGDMIYLSSGASALVSAVRSKWDIGLYNPQTLQGDIVVNDVITTTFTEAVNPVLAMALLAPLRWLFALTGVDSASYFFAS